MFLVAKYGDACVHQVTLLDVVSATELVHPSASLLHAPHCDLEEIENATMQTLLVHPPAHEACFEKKIVTQDRSQQRDCWKQ